MAFCKGLNILCAQVRGIEAICEATFRMYDPATKQYIDKPFSEQMESLICTSTRPAAHESRERNHLFGRIARRRYTQFGKKTLSCQT